MKPNLLVSRRMLRLPSVIEILESRIAPTTIVAVNAGALDVNDAGNGNHNLTFTTNGPATYRFIDPSGISAGNGAIQVNGTTVDVPVSTISGPISIQFGIGADIVTLAGNITTPSVFNLQTGAGADVVNFNGTLGTGGPLNLTTGGTVNVSGAIALGSGQTMTANADGTIHLISPAASITATGTGGVMLATGQALVLDAGSHITTNGGDIMLKTDALDLLGQLDANGSRAVAISPFTPGTGINLGSATDPVGGPLSLSDTEIDRVSGGFLNLGDGFTGTVTVSAGLTVSNVETLGVTAGPTFSIRFISTGQIDAGPNSVILASGGALQSGGVPVEVIAGALSLATIGADIGSVSNPLGFSALSLDVTTNGSAGNAYLHSTTTVDFTSLDAASGTIFLVGGTFVADISTGAINPNSSLGVDGTLDLNGRNLSVAILGSLNGSSGIVTNSSSSPAVLTCNVGLGTTAVFLGTIQDGFGPVGLTKLGGGTEVLSGANTYSSGTTVNGGKLRLVETPNGTPGTGPISIGAGASFVSDHTANFSLPNDLSGAGTFEKTGTGTLSLTGTNTMTGNILITAGTLQVGNGGSQGGLGTGTVIDNSLLRFNRIGSISVANDISGTGAIYQAGIGTLALSGNNTYIGHTTVGSGSTLRFDTFCAALDTATTLDGGTLVYNLGGTHTASPNINLSANSTVNVASGSRMDWGGNAVTGSFNFNKDGRGVLSHDDSVWNTKLINVLQGALAATTSTAFGSVPIDVTSGGALWADTIGGLSLPNPLTLRGDGSAVDGPGAGYSGALVTTSTGGATFSGTVNLAADTIISTVGGNISLTGIVSGVGGLTKYDPNILVLANKKNSFGLGGSTSITVTDGSIQVAADHALGDAANSLIFTTGGGLITTAGFVMPRNITVDNDTTFNVTGTLQLTGLIGGTGVISKAGPGSIVFGAGYTGTAAVSSGTGTITVGPAKIAFTGAGNALVTVVDNGLGGTKIDSFVLSDTTAATKIVIKGPTGTTLVVDHISSTDAADEIASITLRKGVVLGDGVGGDGAALDVAGKVGKLVVDTIAENTLIRLGTGLAYLDTYNNHPDFNATAIGAGTIIDVIGDGMSAGTGGGGLGKVNIKSWPGAGTIRTTQSITSFQLRTGDCNIVFEVDKLGNGAATVADVGRMIISQGAWGSVGTEIEGAVGNFSAASFLAGATITAGNFLKFSVKSGALAGTVTLAKADDARVGNFTVNGDFTGIVNAAEAIKNLNIKGEFRGTLTAKAIASITAYSFDGNAINDTFGSATRLNIITTEGSLGTLKAKKGLIKNYDISVATIFTGLAVPKVAGVPPVETGITNVAANAGTSITGITSAYPISDSLFASAGTIAKVAVGAAALTANVSNTVILAGADLGDDLALGGVAEFADTFASASITNFKIFGNLTTGSFIGAGVNPVDLILGNVGDLVIGGINSKIPTLAVTGTVSVDSHFSAGFFKKPKISNVVINPLVDARFSLL